MTYEESLAATIDWSATGVSEKNIVEGTPRQQVLAVLHEVRQRGAPFFGFDEGYFARVCARATSAERTSAVADFDRALQSDLLFPPHNNAFAALGPETLALAMTAERAEALAQRVLARQDDWGRNVWSFGITSGVANLLRYLCPLTVVPDDTLLPLLGWLSAIAPVEWRAGLSWNDRILGPSGHNWYAHSLSGLWTAGALFGCFRPLQRFRALAPTYLEREVALLFAEDGWSKEGAAGYHAFAFHTVVACWSLARRHNIVFSGGFEERLRRIADATWRMQGPDDSGPIFGDAGPGKPTPRPYGMSAYGLATRRLAARFGLAEAKAAAEALDPLPEVEFLPDGGEDLAAAYRALTATPPQLDTALPASGLYAMRSCWGSDGDWMAINAMPIGPTVTSHKHADLFNIEVCVRGRRVLVDNWYGDITQDDGSYQSAPEIRNNPMKRRWRVGSSAHNVPVVDDTDIVPVKQIYRYGWNETPLVDGWVSAPDYAWFSAVHEAYRRLTPPVVTVRRKIFYLRGGYWVVIDRFTAGSEDAHAYTQHFFLPECVRDEAAGTVYTRDAGGNLLLLPVAGATGALSLEPCPYPISSYQNPDHIRIDTRGTDVVMAVVLVPFVGATPPVVSATLANVTADGETLSPWAMSGIEIRLPDRTDLLVCQHLHQNHPWECAGRSGAGRLFHSRLGELADATISREAGG